VVEARVEMTTLQAQHLELQTLVAVVVEPSVFQLQQAAQAALAS
jgi:hypothetical protein